MASVDDAIDELSGAMHRLKDSLKGIPYRQGSFRNVHHRFARDAGYLIVQLEAARSLIREGGD